MKKALITLAFLFVFALDWAALHDILKGEPNVWMEWTMVIASAGLALAVIGLWAWRKSKGTGFKV